MSERGPAGSIDNKGEGSGSLQAQPAVTNRGRPTCKFFLTRRGCSHGSECRFSHVVPPPEAREEETAVRERPRGRRSSKPPVCRQFLASSSCKYGDRCRYRHVTRQETDGGHQRGEEDEDQTLQDEVEQTSLKGRGGRREESSSGTTHLLDLTSYPGLGSAGETTPPLSLCMIYPFSCQNFLARWKVLRCVVNYCASMKASFVCLVVCRGHGWCTTPPTPVFTTHLSLLTSSHLTPSQTPVGCPEQETRPHGALAGFVHDHTHFHCYWGYQTTPPS